MQGSEADGLSASYTEGVKAERARTQKTVLPMLAHIEDLLGKAVAGGQTADGEHYINTARQIVEGLKELLAM